MHKNIEILKKWVNDSNNIVFFGGAGVSTESGIPDFRSVDGLYNQKWKYSPETILSHSFFDKDPNEFYRFYHEKLVIKGIEPNITHYKLSELEKNGKLKAIITQNIDGLHQLAGSKNVFELHGSLLKAYCSKCHKIFLSNEINNCSGVPYCSYCGGVIRPDIVLYEEPLNDDILDKSIDYISKCDLLIVGGTSLNVYPAAGLINYYNGNKLVLINLSETAYDAYSNLVIHKKIGEVFSCL